MEISKRYNRPVLEIEALKPVFILPYVGASISAHIVGSKLSALNGS